MFAFMVMPFGRKPTQAEPGKGPAEVDYNALWDKAFFPMLKDLGYRPVRADQDVDALIIHQMIERLYFSDLVLVDLSSPNGNVYYEMGLRHAMQAKGCVLLASDWSRPLFDVAQMRTIRYPLPAGEISDEQASDIRAAVSPRIAGLKAGLSPVHVALKGYPAPVDIATATGVHDIAEQLADVQADLRVARLQPRPLHMQHFDRLHDRYRASLAVPGVAVALLRLLVDAVELPAQWQRVIDYIGSLDPSAAAEAYVLEQRALALGKLKRYDESRQVLLKLIEKAGSTSEREGLLGGRCKSLWEAATAAGETKVASDWLEQAIHHYELGMQADLNDFYPTSNLARLYRARGGPRDEARAQTALQVTQAACDRAIARGSTNEWVRPTLLGVQFDLPDADRAEELLEQIRREDPARWKLESTLKDLHVSLGQVRDPVVKARLQAVYDALRALL